MAVLGHWMGVRGGGLSISEAAYQPTEKRFISRLVVRATGPQKWKRVAAPTSVVPVHRRPPPSATRYLLLGALMARQPEATN